MDGWIDGCGCGWRFVWWLTRRKMIFCRCRDSVRRNSRLILPSLGAHDKISQKTCPLRFGCSFVDVGRISRIFSFRCRREQQPGGGGGRGGEDDGSCTDVSGKGHLWWREFISSSSSSGFFIFSRPIGDDGGRPIMLPKGYVGIQRPHPVWRLHLLHQQILSPGLILCFFCHTSWWSPNLTNCVSKTHESCGKKQHFIFEVLGLLHAAGENSNNNKNKIQVFPSRIVVNSPIWQN